MTKKQFTVTNISENGMKGLFKLGNDTLSIYDVARLINELLEENELLKNKLEFFNELNKPYGSIIKENEELKKKLHFVMKRLDEKDKLLARVLEVNKNLERK